MTDFRAALKEKKRIVIKIGSSSLTHPETGDLNLRKIEQLVRVLSDLRSQGREDSCILRSYRRRTAGAGIQRTAQAAGRKAGICRGWPGQAHDGLSKAVCRI